MNQDSYALSRYRFDKAKEDLESSKVNFQNNLLSASINRSYYSIFHAARALLAFDDFDSKKHSGIISYFNRNYIKSGKIEKEYSKILMSAEIIRNETDYMDFYIVSKEEAKTQIENAE